MSTAGTELRTLGFVRVLFGTLVLLRTTPVLAPLHVPYLVSTFPLLGWPTAEWHVAAWGLALPAGVVASLCVARTVALLLFTLGVRARASGVSAGVAAWIVLAQDVTGYINTLSLLFLGLVVLGLSGAGSASALRAELEGDPRSGLALTRAFVVSVYAWSGVAKVNLSWLRGDVLERLHANGLVRGALSDALLSSPAGCAAVAWAVAVVELTLGPLLLWPRSRRLALVGALSLHMALEMAIRPDFFGFAMTVLLLAFVEPRSGPKRAFSSLGATVPVMRVAAAYAALVAIVGCNAGTTETPPLDASMPRANAAPHVADAAPAGDPGSTIDAMAEAAYAFDAAVPISDSAAEGNALGVDFDATGLDAAGPDPLPQSCEADAGSDAAVCPLPHSRCADSQWLVFYDNGQCISGQCTWEKRYVRCLGNPCFANACQQPPTM